MKREDLQQLALDLARDLKALCHREPDRPGVEEILRWAANASSWRDLLRRYCRPPHISRNQEPKRIEEQ